MADDDPATRRLIAAVIESEGFDAIEAGDGKEAYRILKSNRTIIAAIIDVMMPYIEGTELTRFISSDERFRGIPVIIVSAGSNPSAKAVGLRAGAAAFLSKPFSNLQLRALIRTFAGLRKDRRHENS